MIIGKEKKITNEKERVTEEQMKKWRELEEIVEKKNDIERLQRQEAEEKFCNVWKEYTNQQALEIYKKMNKYAYITTSIRTKRFLYTLGYDYTSLTADGVENFIFFKDKNFDEVIDFYIRIRKENKLRAEEKQDIEW